MSECANHERQRVVGSPCPYCEIERLQKVAEEHSEEVDRHAETLAKNGRLTKLNEALMDAIDSMSVAVNSPDWLADEEILRISAIENAANELFAEKCRVEQLLAEGEK